MTKRWSSDVGLNSIFFQKKIQVENESTNTEMVLLAGCSGGNNDKGEIISEMGRDWEEVDCKSARA